MSLTHSLLLPATKCDDISCSEVIRALNLDDDPELEKINDEIDQCHEDTDTWKEKKGDAEAAAKGLLILCHVSCALY